MRILSEKVGDESDIFIEVDEEKSVFDFVNNEPTRGDFGINAFSKGISLIETCARQIAAKMKDLEKQIQPDTVEVEMQVKFNSEIGAIITKSNLGAHLKVKLTWIKKES